MVFDADTDSAPESESELDDEKELLCSLVVEVVIDLAPVTVFDEEAFVFDEDAVNVILVEIVALDSTLFELDIEVAFVRLLENDMFVFDADTDSAPESESELDDEKELLCSLVVEVVIDLAPVTVFDEEMLPLDETDADSAPDTEEETVTENEREALVPDKVTEFTLLSESESESVAVLSSEFDWLRLCVLVVRDGSARTNIKSTIRTACGVGTMEAKILLLLCSLSKRKRTSAEAKKLLQPRQRTRKRTIFAEEKIEWRKNVKQELKFSILLLLLATVKF
jgi:hypothetical protein